MRKKIISYITAIVMVFSVCNFSVISVNAASSPNQYGDDITHSFVHGIVNEDVWICDYNEIYGDLYILNGNTFSNDGTLTVYGDVYVFGTLENYGTLYIEGTLYGLHYGNMMSAGNYNYGYIQNKGSLNSDKMVIKDDFLNVELPKASHDFTDPVIIEKPSCVQEGKAEQYCTYCGYYKIESIPKSEEHSYWWYHTQYMGDNAYDLKCDVCNKNFGRGYYCEDDGFYYIYDFKYGDPDKHLVCDEQGNVIRTESCKIFIWDKDEEYHEGYCNCHAVLCEMEDHVTKTTIVKASTTQSGKSVTKCKVCEYVASSYTIAKPNKIKLSTAKYVYNGKAKKPTVKVYDSKGNLIAASNYTVKYANGRKNVGKYKVTVTFKNTSKKYKGSFSTTFKIVPKATSITKLTKAKKAFTVKWKKKTTQVSGYQIRYSTKSDMSNAKTKLVKSNKTTNKKITGLKGGKKYYVQVRTYKTVNGTKYYSAWSGKKSVKTTGSSSSNTGNNDVISGNTVYITSTGSKYHFNKNCRGLSNANSIKSISLSSAKAQGYTLCGYED